MKTRKVLLTIIIVACISVLSYGCKTTIPIKVSKTNIGRSQTVLKINRNQIPEKVMFLSRTEAKCPTQCSDVFTNESQKTFVSYIEQQLMKNGYSLISGAIVSRVEKELEGNVTREEWDRTEKALLLGEETGADAIFEVRRMHIDMKDRYFLKDPNGESFTEVPKLYAENALVESNMVSVFMVPFWEATVELRMIDMDGNVIWSSLASVKSTDIIPSAWKADLVPAYPAAFVSRNRSGRGKKENYDYKMYCFNSKLIEKQMYIIIDSLMKKLPSPSD